MACGRRLRFRTRSGGEETLHIDGRRAGSPQAEFTEYLDEGQCLAARADGDEMSDLAGETSVPTPDPTVTDDGAAQAFAEEQVREVVQCRGAGVIAFGLRGTERLTAVDLATGRTLTATALKDPGAGWLKTIGDDLWYIAPEGSAVVVRP